MDNTTSHWFKSHLRDVPRDECLELLEGRQVGRVCFVDPDGPVALPVNYAIHDGNVLIATSPHNSLAQHAVGQPVAFEVDDIDEYNETGWSVLVKGLASEVAHDDLPGEVQRPNPWVEGNRTLVLRITPSQVSGRYLLPG